MLHSSMSGDKRNVEKGSLTEEQHKGVKDINFNFNRAKTLLDRETNIKFLSFKGNNLFICGKLYTAIC